MKRCRIHRLANQDLADSAWWYEEREPGLGTDFVEEVEHTIELITRNPLACATWPPNRRFRKRPVQRFDHIVFFEVVDGSVHILAVAHSRRRPGYWRRRAST